MIRIVEPAFCPFPSVDNLPKGTIVEDKRVQASASSVATKTSGGVSTPPPAKKIKI